MGIEYKNASHFVAPEPRAPAPRNALIWEHDYISLQQQSLLSLFAMRYIL